MDSTEVSKIIDPTVLGIIIGSVISFLGVVLSQIILFIKEQKLFKNQL